MSETASVTVHEVDLVQTDASGDDHGTLYVELTVDGRERVRVYRNFPVALYEEWMERDFAEAMYLADIDPLYPRTEEEND